MLPDLLLHLVEDSLPCVLEAPEGAIGDEEEDGRGCGEAAHAQVGHGLREDGVLGAKACPQAGSRECPASPRDCRPKHGF